MRLPRRWARRVLRGDAAIRVACRLVHLCIRFVYATNRWTVVGGEIPERLRAAGGGFIVAFWHGRLMMMPMERRRIPPMHMLISAHRDGRVIAGAMTHFGVDTIVGSTRRGGLGALRTMLKWLEAGECVGITPDGPRGPAMQASDGIVNVARLAGVPIVPVVFATSRRIVLRSWDRFYLALPFGRGVYLVGTPIPVAPDLDAEGIERTRLVVESRLNAMADEADRLVGHRPSMPARGELRVLDRRPKPGHERV